MRAATALYWTIIAAGGALAIAALPSALAFMASAGWEFWFLSALAVGADIQPIRPPPAARRWADYAMSVGICVPILLLYGVAAAIVVECVAVVVVARGLHLSAQRWTYLTARLVCCFAAAGLTADVVGVSRGDFRGAAALRDALTLALVAAVFTIVGGAANVVAALVGRASRHEILKLLRFDLVARAAVVSLGIIIAAALQGWLLLLLFVVVVGWSQLARLLVSMQRRAEYDPSTGVLSRLGMAAAMLNLPRDGDRDWFGLVLIQLRGIPYVVRNVGNTAAEHMMNTAVARLRSEARPGDLIGRAPGAHLMIVRRGLSEAMATSLASQFVRALLAPVESVEGIPFRVDPIAGVALAPQHGRDLRQLLPHAEAALSDAAALRRAVHVYEPEVPSHVDDRLELLRRLTVAVTDPEHASEIAMFFQPQVSIATGRTNSVEALLRWHPPERDRIPTDELLRIVEPTGLMQQLTQHILDRVVRQLRDWNDAGLHLRAAVNVSPLDLTTDEEFHLQVADTLRRHDISPTQLDIEVTERAMVDETDVLDAAAHRVAQLGVGISLDDFGTGFASLRRLRHFPLTEVKIDRSYVSKIVESPQDHAMVKSIYDIAQVLRLRLVAEGVEDEPTVRMLADLGHIIGQGWYYAQPMPPAELTEWLRDRGDYTPPI